MATLASLIFCPAAGRSSAGSLPEALELLGEQALLAEQAHAHLLERREIARDAPTSASACSMSSAENAGGGHGLLHNGRRDRLRGMPGADPDALSIVVRPSAGWLWLFLRSP